MFGVQVAARADSPSPTAVASEVAALRSRLTDVDAARQAVEAKAKAAAATAKRELGKANQERDAHAAMVAELEQELKVARGKVWFVRRLVGRSVGRSAVDSFNLCVVVGASRVHLF